MRYRVICERPTYHDPQFEPLGVFDTIEEARRTGAEFVQNHSGSIEIIGEVSIYESSNPWRRYPLLSLSPDPIERSKYTETEYECVWEKWDQTLAEAEQKAAKAEKEARGEAKQRVAKAEREAFTVQTIFFGTIALVLLACCLVPS